MTRPYRRRPPRERFERLVRVEENGCHTWLGALGTTGYGQFYLEGKNYAAHRAAWFFAYGEWPPPWPESGIVVNHKCHNSACVNVEHLELITSAENLQNIQRSSKRSRDVKPKKNQHCECCAEWRFNNQTKTYVPKYV